jgi:hypothetical protein
MRAFLHPGKLWVAGKPYPHFAIHASDALFSRSVASDGEAAPSQEKSQQAGAIRADCRKAPGNPRAWLRKYRAAATGWQKILLPFPQRHAILKA